MKAGLLLCIVLASSAVRADPEGYRGGEGRPPGTTYAPPGAPTLTVRSLTVQRGQNDGTWTCGGLAVARGTEDLVTVTLVMANPTRSPISGYRANVDLVFDHDGTHVVEGGCLKDNRGVADTDLRAKERRIVRERFFVPRGATPKILVYNDDDFPALFALPRATRSSSRAPARRP